MVRNEVFPVGLALKAVSATLQMLANARIDCALRLAVTAFISQQRLQNR